MFTLNCKGRQLVIDEPLVMGIINITPDSFYDGSRFEQSDTVLRQAEKMLTEGATIIDIGGQSTRPGSETIGAEEELARIIEPIKKIAATFPESIISIDTYHAKVAQEAVHAGASIVNDISAGAFDPLLLPTVASLEVPYVLMHMRGTPVTMQSFTQYNHISQELLGYFHQKKSELTALGIRDIIIDPGFGFAKTAPQNFELLREMAVFKDLNCPVLAGLSRKSTITKTLGITAAEAINGTTVMNTIALLNGASILRVHDVKEARETIRLVQAYKK